MRFLIKLLSVAGVSLLLAISAQAESITPQEAYHHAGDMMTVEGVVSQVSTSGGGATFINFGGRYPTTSSMPLSLGIIQINFPESKHWKAEPSQSVGTSNFTRVSRR
jgi:hypothetical protein